MSESVLVVIGCGPGIGLATASLFVTEVFNEVALISRNATRLQDYKASIVSAAAAKNKSPKVNCWSVDISNTAELNSALTEIEGLGHVSCVLFNAARVGPSPFFDFEEEALIEDFKTTNVALYTTARWAIPLLEKKEVDKPSLLVTNSLLWQEPIPQLFSLSLTKTAQRSLVQSLQATYPDVHIALLDVAGPVTPEDKERSPDLVAKKFLEILLEEKSSWSREVII